MNKNLFSFAHGNTYAKHKKFSENKEKSEIIHTSNSKHNYKIQNNFLDVDNTELFFKSHPVKSNFSVNDEKHYLEKNCSKLINVKKTKNITINSNCYYLRPLIFNYKKKLLRCASCVIYF